MGFGAATWRKRGDFGRRHRTGLIPNRLNQGPLARDALFGELKASTVWPYYGAGAKQLIGPHGGMNRRR